MPGARRRGEDGGNGGVLQGGAYGGCRRCTSGEKEEEKGRWGTSARGLTSNQQQRRRGVHAEPANPQDVLASLLVPDRQNGWRGHATAPFPSARSEPNVSGSPACKPRRRFGGVWRRASPESRWGQAVAVAVAAAAVAAAGDKRKQSPGLGRGSPGGRMMLVGCCPCARLTRFREGRGRTAHEHGWLARMAMGVGMCFRA